MIKRQLIMPAISSHIKAIKANKFIKLITNK